MHKLPDIESAEERQAVEGEYRKLRREFEERLAFWRAAPLSADAVIHRCTDCEAPRLEYYARCKICGLRPAWSPEIPDYTAGFKPAGKPPGRKVKDFVHVTFAATVDRSIEEP